MNRATIDPAEAWAWCLRAYAQPGVADDLLRAQDEQGLDITLHLYLRYLRERHGIELDADAQHRLALAVHPWRSEVVRHLRELRRAIKAKPAPGAGSRQEAESVRRLIKQAELQAEKAQLVMMCEWMQSAAPSSPPSRG